MTYPEGWPVGNEWKELPVCHFADGEPRIISEPGRGHWVRVGAAFGDPKTNLQNLAFNKLRFGVRHFAKWALANYKDDHLFAEKVTFLLDHMVDEKVTHSNYGGFRPLHSAYVLLWDKDFIEYRLRF